MTSARMVEVAPILPVSDLAAALRHYKSLGFRTRQNEGGEYGFAARDGVELHLTYQPASYYPAGAIVVVYIEVDDADALYQQWTKPGVGGQTALPAPMPWGMNEGTHTDPDGNIIRYGSPTA